VPWRDSRGPKAAATGERDDGDVERYESLRHRALGGEPSGCRLGLAVLQHRGVAAWLRAGQTLPTPSPRRPPADMPMGGDELVGVLANMALACIGRG
jgi:hypothetical protein